MATVWIRVAVIAPAPFNALVGIASLLFALGITRAYNTFAPPGAGAPTAQPSAQNGAKEPAQAAEAKQ
jgi:hypothetical protein